MSVPAGHPRNHGYEKCDRCKTWRRLEALDRVPDVAMTEAMANIGGVLVTKLVCRDVAWCGAQAGVGRGTMDGKET